MLLDLRGVGAANVYVSEVMCMLYVYADVFCFATFSFKGMLTPDLIGLLIMSSISCVSFILFLMYDIEIKFDDKQINKRQTLVFVRGDVSTLKH